MTDYVEIGGTKVGPGYPVYIIGEIGINHNGELDIAKRLIDHGFHPPTIYFPLVVHGAIMIEPTESESKETIDAFVATMKSIAEEARRDPETLKASPRKPIRARLDETRAALARTRNR